MNIGQQTAQAYGIHQLRSHTDRSDENFTLTSQSFSRMRKLHELVARHYGNKLSDLLRAPVAIRLADIELIDYGHFVHNTSVPTCFYVLSDEPSNERLLLDIEPTVLHPMIDRLLGSPMVDESPPDRPMTEIEWRLAARIVGPLLQELQNVWREAIDLNLKVFQTECDPRPLRILPEDESIIAVGFELSIGNLQGMMNLCIPKRMVDRFHGFSSEHSISSESSLIEITLAETTIDANALADLQIGDIIATETPADSLVMVSIDGAVSFLGKPGSLRGRKAVRLVKMVENPPINSSESSS